MAAFPPADPWQMPPVPNPRPVGWPPVPFPDPEIHNALRKQRILVWEDGVLNEEIAFLRRDADDVERAYQLISDKPHIDLTNIRGERRGWIRYAAVLTRVPDMQPMRFQRTDNVVVIKQLRLNYITPYLEQGGPENPYNEISVMQQHGDDDHIIRCIEALRDKKYLFIVMRYLRYGDLHDNNRITWRLGGYRDPAYLQMMIRKLVTNILYLRKHQIINRDLSLENVLVDGDNNVFPMIDFAMSLKWPVFENENENENVHANRSCGKLPCMSPEVACPPAFNNRIGEPVNVWMLGVLIYNTLTGCRMYESPGDIFFRHLVDYGLTNDIVNQWYLFHYDENDLIHSHVQRIRNLDDNARDLLDQMMKWLPEDRLSSDQILAHPWFAPQGGAEMEMEIAAQGDDVMEMG